MEGRAAAKETMPSPSTLCVMKDTELEKLQHCP